MYLDSNLLLFKIIEEKNPGDKTLEKLCASLCKMSKLGKVDSTTLQQWLSKVIFGGTTQVICFLFFINIFLYAYNVI